MKIRILKDTVCDGASVKAGAVIDARPDSAAFLIRIGKAAAEQESRPPETDRAIVAQRLPKRR